jgi:hypothetical protein
MKYSTDYDKEVREVVREETDAKGVVWIVVSSGGTEYSVRKEWVELWIAGGKWKVQD